MLSSEPNEDASTEAVLDHYGIPVDAAEFLDIVAAANSILDIQQATRSPREAVRPALRRLDLLDAIASPHEALIANRRGR